MMLNREMLFKAAADAGFVRTEACCEGVGLKMCSGDVWKGNASVFASRVVSAVNESHEAELVKTDAVIDAARVVLREALDNASVHPCDTNSDDARAMKLPDNLFKLYMAVRDVKA